MHEWRYENRGGCCNCCGGLTLLLVLVVGLALLSVMTGGR